MFTTDTDTEKPITPKEYALAGCGLLSFVLGILLVATICGGCVYKGGKVVDGSNIEIGLCIPGTEWSINVLSYTSGLKVGGNQDTSIVVTNAVTEENSYFGVVKTKRVTSMEATISPVETGKEEK